MIKQIYKTIEDVVEELIQTSETYEEALENFKKQKLSFAHGELGIAIDNLIERKIKFRALKSEVK